MVRFRLEKRLGACRPHVGKNFGYPNSMGGSVIVVPLSQVLILWHSLSDGVETQLMPLQSISSNELQSYRRK
ncbi:hypothetical protein ACSS6W_002645 [Trichoderma asperelloides]